MTVELTSLDKVLWPASGFTKRQLIDYYVAVADVLIPHIAGRPMTRSKSAFIVCVAILHGPRARTSQPLGLGRGRRVRYDGLGP